MIDTDIPIMNSLIKVCLDGEEGFNAAAEDVKDETVCASLHKGAQHCRTSAEELQAFVRQLGGQPETSGSMLGSAHRGWLEVKATLAPRTDEAVLSACERGEQIARERYEAILEQIGISPELRHVVERQYQGVLINLDRVRKLWSSYAKIPP